jgi:GntR family transcriptional regulator
MMIDVNAPKPIYQQIRDYILQQIQSGELPPNTKLSSERNLATQLGVNRLTVNRAIKELEQAGWVHKQIGKGTYVSEPPIHQEISVLRSFTEDMAERGQTTYSRVLHLQYTKPPQRIAERLDLPANAQTIQLERVRYANNRPVALENSFINAPSTLLNYDFTRASLYSTLKDDFGMKLVQAEQSFEARAATEREADHLEVATGVPVLAIHRLTYTDADCPVEVVHSVYRGDRYRFRALLRRLSEEN